MVTDSIGRISRLPAAFVHPIAPPAVNLVPWPEATEKMLPLVGAAATVEPMFPPRMPPNTAFKMRMSAFVSSSAFATDAFPESPLPCSGIENPSDTARGPCTRSLFACLYCCAMFVAKLGRCRSAVSVPG